MQLLRLSILERSCALGPHLVGAGRQRRIAGKVPARALMAENQPALRMDTAGDNALEIAILI